MLRAAIRPTKDVRSPSCIARSTCCLTKACQGPTGSAVVDVGLFAMKYWMNAERPGPPSIRLPNSASSVMDRSNSSAAAVACWRWHAYMNASFTAARSSPFVSRQCANAIDVAERGKELERSRKKASAVEEIDQGLSTTTLSN